ncbi:hypothetical protein V5N11_003550 [Cardamine amara subsp. amara]|uniref:Tf2-1-like SH3-like domain-containing protein n=1 Tax=Cardamine amara subsp. amara TaxID=228776 RepID=A0ABD1C203_CARAN
MINMESAELFRKLHEKVRANIERMNESTTKVANKGRRKLIYKPGDWLWLHFRPESFPYKITERINNNAYCLELPGEYNVSTSFNVTDRAPFDASEDQFLT